MIEIHLSLRSRARSPSPAPKNLPSRGSSIASPPAPRRSYPTIDDNCSVTSECSVTSGRTRKVSGPGKAWYKGYVSNCKINGSTERNNHQRNRSVDNSRKDLKNLKTHILAKKVKLN